IIVGSRFDAPDPVPVEGAGAMSGFGTYDMAGNVKEWCLNEGIDGKRYIAGGGFDEPRYMFVVPDALSPWTRTRATGFRGVVLASPPPAELTAPIAEPSRDFRVEIASDETFAAYRRLYAYDRTPLHARVDAVEDTPEWRVERVSFDAAYNGERVAATLY